MLASASIPLDSNELADVIGRALHYPIDDVVNRYAKEKGLPLQVPREEERELERYLALCAIRGNDWYSMADPVADLWHKFITSYTTLEHTGLLKPLQCSVFLGERFPHRDRRAFEEP